MGAQFRRQFAISCAMMAMLVMVLPNGLSCYGDDWPVFQQNNQRNAKSLENLDSQKLSLAWTWKSSGPPESAWSGPAKWDAYAGIKGLKSMRNYDPVFHVVSVGDRVWFASSVEECVRCLDAATGKEIWVFYAEGPVRIAPAYADGKVYFGSDDGFAYCVDANHGQLVWKFQPRPTKRKVLNNGRLISQWPIRTGVLVDNGIAYFGASLLPWEKSYLCAVDALTGSHEGDGLYVNEMEDATMEGPMAIAPGKLLIAPQGRVPPQMFQVSDGKSLGSLSGGGGSFVVLTKDSVFHGPGNKTGWLTASNLQTRETVASFQSGNAMIVAGDTSLIQTDHAISAANYATRQSTWSTDCECPFTMALAGNTIFTGGQDQVVAYSANDGKRQGRIVVDGKAYGLAIANGTLFVSTDTGAIHAFRAGDQTVADNANDDSVAEPNSIENLEGLVPVPPFESNQLVNRWVFQRPHVQGLAVEDLAGDSTISVNGRIQLFRTGSFQSAKCDNSIGGYEVTRDVKSKLLPQRQFTAEAWVRIDEPLTWGGIIGCLQDNGDFERGWLLGYSDDR
ncbi:MAG: PQQ-binding-like beta-propeller repeat protein, partial [Planctomycetales bacterium]|nr:PQQ-binding-like beta-propeller repeat protein [Planctomycetales bacterium]